VVGSPCAVDWPYPQPRPFIQRIERLASRESHALARYAFGTQPARIPAETCPKQAQSHPAGSSSEVIYQTESVEIDTSGCPSFERLLGSNCKHELKSQSSIYDELFLIYQAFTPCQMRSEETRRPHLVSHLVCPRRNINPNLVMLGHAKKLSILGLHLCSDGGCDTISNRSERPANKYPPRFLPRLATSHKT
jgi:hypothetical protein